MSDFQTVLNESAEAVDTALDRLLAGADRPEGRVVEAMRYAALAPGKRIRPFLVIAGSRLFRVAEKCAVRVAAAIEMVHCYSLVHDDLPAMDDDDLRRGRPTTHIEFDEATAILAGDALLTKAFEVLGEDDTHSDATVRAKLVVALAKAAGDEGMVGGQMLDLTAEDRELSMPEITRLQRMKTGALIAFSAEAGAILGKAPETSRQALHHYAHDLGLAFQIVDDLLDVTSTAEEMGKRTQKDEDAGKATFVTLLGIEGARERADMLAQQAIRHLDVFDAEDAAPLAGLARFVVERRK